jgi:hypothetical protein
MDPKIFQALSCGQRSGFLKAYQMYPESIYSIAMTMAAATTTTSRDAVVGGTSLYGPPLFSSLSPLFPEGQGSQEDKSLSVDEILEIADDILSAEDDPLMTATVHDITTSSSSSSTPASSRPTTPAPSPELEIPVYEPPNVGGKRNVNIVQAGNVMSAEMKGNQVEPFHAESPPRRLSPGMAKVVSPTPSVVSLATSRKTKRSRREAMEDGSQCSESLTASEDEAEDDDDNGDKNEDPFTDLDDLEQGSNSSQGSNEIRLRPYQAGQWNTKFKELCQYREEHGNCLVPHNYNPNMLLARWVKRQRYQYKLHKEGKSSTMTEERIAALSAVGFVWDSQGSAWEERLVELKDFCDTHGHCNVPCTYKANPPLAAWVKCQRRQYKLYRNGSPSNITAPRIQQLENLGFEWEPRIAKRKEKAIQRDKKMKMSSS